MFRHYRVTQRDQGGYVIDVENPVSVVLEDRLLFKTTFKAVPDEFDLLLQIPCADLHEVIDALVEKTAGTLQPFLLEEPYEENISTNALHSVRTSLFFCLSSCDGPSPLSSAYVSANDENGERILHMAPSSPLPKAPALPPKQGEAHTHLAQT